MNKKKLICALLLLAVVTGVFSSCGSRDDEGLQIALIAKSGTSYFWLTCFQGAEAAAAEYNDLTLNIDSPEVEWDYQTQNDLIEEAIENGADAIVFSACDHENSVSYVEKALDSGIPVITIDSGISIVRDITFIGTDNYEAGRMAAAAVIENVGETAGVSIVSFEETSGNGAQRVQGFLDYMAEYPGIEILEIFYSPSDYDLAQNAAAEMMDTYGDELDAIATFNELTTIGVGRAAQATENPASVFVVGFDNNIESVQMLEDGYIDSLMIQNSFAMGYLGVQQAIAEIKGEAVQTNVDTGTEVATRENMYTPEMEKLLFPFSDG